MITADFDTLMRQAPMTAQTYLSEAVQCIDGQFGEGYAAENPQLVAAFMQVSGQDFNSASLAKEIGEAAEILRDAIVSATENFSA